MSCVMDRHPSSVSVATRSIEQVLSPIAEQVSQLIVLDENARQTGAAMPDLSGAAAAVNTAVSTLVQAGRNSTTNADDQLKMTMGPACDQAEAAGQLFSKGCEGLKLDPRDGQARAKIVESARGILSGTTAILMAFDGYEVRKIAGVGEQLVDQLTLLSGVTTLEALVPAIKALTSSLVTFTQLTDARHEELINASMRSQIMIALETVRKSSPLLVSAMRTYLNNIESVQAQASKQYALDQLLNAVNQIVHVVTSTDLDESKFNEKPGDLANDIDVAQQQLSQGDPHAVEAVERVIAKSTVLIDSLRAGGRNDELADQCEAVKESLNKLKVSPQSHRGAASNDTQQDIGTLDALIKEAVIEEISETLIATEDPNNALDALTEMANDTQFSKDEVELAGDAFRLHTGRLNTAAKNVATTSMDAKRVKMVDVTTKQLEEYSVQIINAAIIVKENPNHKVSRDHLTLLKSNWESRVDALKAILDGLTDASRVVGVTEGKLTKQIDDAVMAAQAGDRSGVAETGRKVANRVHHVVTLAKSEIENSEDPNYTKPIEAATAHLENLTPQFVEALNNAAAFPGNTEVDQNLAQLLQDVTGAVTSVRDAIKTRFNEPEPEDLQSEIEARVEEEEEEAQDTVGELPVIAKTEGPIADAAAHLRRETDRWRKDGNPIVQTAQKMAGHMQQMAALANVNKSTADELPTHSGIVGVAKAIAEESKEIVKTAKQIAEGCSDKRLRADLLYICDRIPTISTQLKIIASVKATATGRDVEDADAMLVKNAYNLMDAVQRAVRACEAASLKQFSQAASLALFAIKWRRKNKTKAAGGYRPLASLLSSR